uniref:Uncharacterized protein n=1 Tax=Angiostrongylus cantonensis TaxID=6313 RepID=A0A0K0DHY3_ANGCA
MHLCERQLNFTRRTCCQLVLLLNDTTRVESLSQLTKILTSVHRMLTAAM